MPEHRKVQKRSQKTQSIQDKRRNMQKENVAAKEEMRKQPDYVKQKEERIFFLSDKVAKNKMADAEMAAELQGLQAGEERRGSNASQAVECCMETMVVQFFAMGADQARSKFDALCQVFFKKFEAYTPSAQMPGKGGGRRNSEDEQEQGKASQQLLSLTSGRCNEGTSASRLELDFPRVRGAFAECGGAGKSGTAKDRKDLCPTPKSTSDGRGCKFVRSMNGNGMSEPLVLNKKERETARARTQEPLMETANVETLVPLKQTVRERTQEPLKNQLKGSEFRRSGRKRSKDKNKQRSTEEGVVGKSAKKGLQAFLAAKWKGEEDEKKDRKSDRRPNKSWGSLEDCSFSLCFWDRIGFVSMLQQKDRRKGLR